MFNSFSISQSMRWLHWILFLISVPSAFECTSRSSGLVNGFETPSRYTSPKRIQESILRKEEQSSESSPLSFRKYDLGLGKNEPLLPNDKPKAKRPATASSSSATSFSHDKTIATYDACRFLVEHEATRAYPAPEKKRTDTKKSSSNDPFVDTTTTTILGEGTCSHQKNDCNTPKKEQHQAYWGTKAISKASSALSVSSESSPRRKPKPPVKVQPKRLLEDCLIILDHDNYSESTKAVPVSMNSTIWSHPDTPQLDMNSVWVEMLLHNQMGLSQQQHQS